MKKDKKKAKTLVICLILYSPFQQQRLHLLDRRGVVPADHPHSVVATLRLACQQVAQQHWRSQDGQVEALYLRSLQIFEQSLGPEHLGVAPPLNNLGDLYREQGHYEQAEPLCQRALLLFEQILGPEHPNVASMLDTLIIMTQVTNHQFPFLLLTWVTMMRPTVMTIV